MSTYGIGNQFITYASGTTATTQTISAMYDAQNMSYNWSNIESPVVVDKPSPKSFYKQLKLETKEWLKDV